MAQRYITSFSGEFAFLSNFYRFPFLYRGLVWPTAEHAYQAAKFHPGAYSELIRKADTPAKAKKMGRVHPIQTLDWEMVKLTVMKEILWAKFSQPAMAPRLLETEGYTLVEGNTWGDRFWGASGDPLRGENWLGVLLMQTREKLWEVLP